MSKMTLMSKVGTSSREAVDVRMIWMPEPICRSGGEGEGEEGREERG
jgi:hypothetical protein